MIRFFQRQDKENLLSLAKELYAADILGYNGNEKNFSEFFDMALSGSPYVKGISVLHAGEYLGYCCLRLSYDIREGKTEVTVTEIYVKPEFQNKGVAGQIFDFIFSQYDSKSTVFKIECYKSNERALRLYRRLGFASLDYIQMSKQ